MSQNLQSLLGPDEAEVPPAVERTRSFFERAGLWSRFDRNSSAMSCRDAATKRNRLGHQGIDLRDELKSFIGSYVDAAGSSQYFMAHCRGDRRLDFERLQQALEAVELPVRLSEDQTSQLGIAYGLVNPFGFDVVQVFDEETLADCGLPGTMMTNAGDLTWAVEFVTRALIEALPRVKVARIAEADPENVPRGWGPRRPFKLGIITGNAPESGMALWAKINEEVRTRLGERGLGDISMPEVLVHSLPAMGLTMELDLRHEAVWPRIQKAVEGLASSGATTIVIACNTSQFFVPRLRELVGSAVEIVSMPEVLAAHLRSSSIKKVALVGIGYVVNLECGWSGYRDAFAEFEVEPLSAEASKKLHDLAYSVKRDGSTPAGTRNLRKILNKYVESRTIILALTELSLLLQNQKEGGPNEKTYVDPLAILARELALSVMS